VRAVVVLARAPSAPGKTRLTGHLRADRARELREALLLDTLDRARGLASALMVAFTPDDSCDEMRALAGSLPMMPQRGADLGERMFHAMSDAFFLGADAVALVGSDLPTLPPQRLADAFARLDAGSDVVLGPSTDGGFYLIAARGAAPDLFRGIVWSTDRVLLDVSAAAQGNGLSVALLAPCRDVDVPEDLDRILETEDLDDASRVRRWCAVNWSRPPARSDYD
jgi:uncharacterized protein